MPEYQRRRNHDDLARAHRAGPDEWFPISTGIVPARAEAARALAVCTVCPVRAECLELSLRHWAVVGRHGVWGGLVETERDLLRGEWLNGVPVTALLSRVNSQGKSLGH